MTGFEPGSSGIVGDRSANCATTTSPKMASQLLKRSAKMWPENACKTFLHV